MSTPPLNRFEDKMELVLVKELLARIGSSCQRIVRGEVGTQDEGGGVEVLPSIIVSTSRCEEELFQSGIYRAAISITVKTDLDVQAASKSADLFALVMDFLQDTDLKTILVESSPDIFLHGLIVGPQETEGVDDRRLVKKVELEAIGFGSSG